MSEENHEDDHSDEPREERAEKRKKNFDDNDNNDDNDDVEEAAAVDGVGVANLPNAEESGKKKRAKKASFPLSRVRAIVAQDGELGPFRRESLMLLGCAAEQFVAHLTGQAESNAGRAGRRLVRAEDIVKAVHDIDTLEFLKCSFPKKEI